MLIKDSDKFAKHVLPIFFKHKSFASFIRQVILNLFKVAFIVLAQYVPLQKTENRRVRGVYLLSSMFPERSKVSQRDPCIRIIESIRSLLEKIKRKNPNVKNDLSLKKEDTVISEPTQLKQFQRDEEVHYKHETK